MQAQLQAILLWPPIHVCHGSRNARSFSGCISRPRLFYSSGPTGSRLSFFQSETMRALLELKFESCVLGPAEGNTGLLLLPAFKLLSSLTWLHLLRCTLDANALIAVSSPPALRTLIIGSGFRPGNRWKRGDLETPATFNFMEERPVLQVIIRTRPDSASPSGMASAAYFARMQSCVQRFPNRFRIETGEVPPKLRRRERGHEIVPRFDRGLRKEPRRMFNSQATPMDRTPDALVQLVMQPLDLHSLLAFARCSRRMRQLADTPRVWSHLKRELSLAMLPHTRSRLMRHIPLTVHCYRFGGVGLFDRAIRGSPFLNVLEVDMRYPGHGPDFVFVTSQYDAACVRLMQRSAMARVEVLRLSYHHSGLGYYNGQRIFLACACCSSILCRTHSNRTIRSVL